MKFKLIINIISLLFIIYSFTFLAPALVGLFYNEFLYFKYYLLAILVSLVIFLPTLFVTRSVSKERLGNKESILVVLCFWLIISFSSSFLLYLMPLGLSFTNSFFETMSGLTTTGATIFDNLDTLPKSVLFYRSQLQWLGGLGIIIFMVAVLPILGAGQLYKTEITGITKDKLTPRIKQTAKALLFIYLFLTLACFVLYYLAGMSLFDAISHAMTTLSIGGFSTHDLSIKYFDNIVIEMIAIIFMYFAGINFALYFFAWRKKSFIVFLKNSEFVAYSLWLVILLIIIFVILFFNSDYKIADKLRYTIFNTISFATTTGFTSQNIGSWPIVLQVILLIASCIGACVSSTGGGVKVDRVLILIKHAKQEIKRIIYPNIATSIKMNNKKVSNNLIFIVYAFFIFYILTFIIVFILLLLNGLDLITALSTTFANLNNLGPAFGMASENYKNLPDISKYILSFTMFIGRLEVLIVIALFYRNVLEIMNVIFL